MKMKSGKGNKSNSADWTVCHDENSGKYTAKTVFASHAGHWFCLYEITKDIFEKVGTFEEDDYLSQRLIKNNGRLLFEDTYDKYCGWPTFQVEDTNYRSLCGWAFNDNEEQILNYTQDEEDKALSELAQTIFVAYNNSYKPDLTGETGISNDCGYYYIKHIRNRYSLIYVYTKKGNQHSKVCYTTERINEFIPAMFLFIHPSENHVEWSDIAECDAVLTALRNKYDTDTLKVRYYEFHPNLGESLMCSELINGTWKDGYYCFYKTKDGTLKRQLNKI